MSVTVKIEEVDGISIVELEGRIILGEESGALRETVKNLMVAGERKTSSWTCRT